MRDCPTFSLGFGHILAVFVDVDLVLDRLVADHLFQSAHEAAARLAKSQFPSVHSASTNAFVRRVESLEHQ